ncbi:MAG: MBOAT family O-acyltransferase [Clostridia bacterium]
MVFSSLYFLFQFLPIVLAIYYILPKKYRNFALLIANLVFYGFGEPVYILIMIASIFIDFTHGILVEKYRDKDKIARYFVTQSVVLNLGILIFFKYFDFLLINAQNFIPMLQNVQPLNLPLPIGISFYTFQTMSYTIDIYRQDAKAQRKLIDFGVYVTLFPQLIAGPIVKYKDVAEQLTSRRESMEQFASGVKLFTWGFFKKVMLANNIGMLWDIYKAMPQNELSIVGAWLGIIAFSFQLYFDFSGYSDMARGLGRMLGFEFLENFNFPYISKSATEFWRRWHISLGSWFREYVYIPLGGNKKGTAKLYRNIFVVWVLTGIWHGAEWNFALWGLYYAVILVIEKTFLLKILQKIPSFVSHIYALVVILVGWTLFAIEGNGSSAMGYILTMFGNSSVGFIDSATLYYLANFAIMLILCGLCSVPLLKNVKIPEKIRPAGEFVLIAITLVVCTAYLVDATYNPFLYFRF